jgi:hypothetical protein
MTCMWRRWHPQRPGLYWSPSPSQATPTVNLQLVPATPLAPWERPWAPNNGDSLLGERRSGDIGRESDGVEARGKGDSERGERERGGGARVGAWWSALSMFLTSPLICLFCILFFLFVLYFAGPSWCSLMIYSISVHKHNNVALTLLYCYVM